MLNSTHIWALAWLKKNIVLMKRGIGIAGCLLMTAGFPNELRAQSNVISNDTWWVDDNGNNVLASMGGHITRMDDTYYWVGNDPQGSLNGSDIHLYSSETLGSSSWKHEGKLVDFAPGGGGKNCTLLHSPATGRYVIVAKSGFQFYESVNITGPYTLVNTVNKFQVDSRGGNYKIGGMGTFQDGTNAYVITSRRWLPDTPKSETEGTNHRYTGIYKLTPDFLDVDEEICWLRNDSREAMWLFKKDDTYYMTASHTAGWTASHCYYRTSTNLVDWSSEHEIGMDPVRPGGSQANKIMRSHGTQHRWIMQVGNQWMYGGDRYPYHESESHPMEKGLYIMCPVIWEGEKPLVKWEQTWTVKPDGTAFDYWAQRYSVESGSTGNDDGDVLNNWYEYAFGGNPIVDDAAAILPRAGTISDQGTNWFEYVYRRRNDYQASGLVYTVEVNTNLVSNDWNSDGLIESGFGAVDYEIDSVTNRVSTEDIPEQFIRLRVE